MPWMSWAVFTIEGLLSYILSPEDNSVVLCAFVILSTTTVMIFEALIRVNNKEISMILFSGVLLRVFLLIWDLELSNLHHLPNSGMDSEMYARNAIIGLNTGEYLNGGMYSRFIAFFYKFFGVQRPIAQFVNVLLSMTMVFIILKILGELRISNDVIRNAAALLCLLPNSAIINSILLRETPISLLVAISTIFSIKWFITGSWVWLILSFIASIVGATLHSGSLSILLGIAIFAVLYDRDRDALDFDFSTILRSIFIGSIVLLLFSYFSDSIFGKLQGTTIDGVVLDSETSRGGSGYTVGVNTGNTTIDFLVNTPLRMFYFVATPLPWQWRGLSDIIAFCFSAFFYIYTLYLATITLRNSNHTEYHGIIIMLLFLAIASAFMFGWGVSNSGTALRHREKFTSIYVLLYCFCIENKYRLENSLS